LQGAGFVESRSAQSWRSQPDSSWKDWEALLLEGEGKGCLVCFLLPGWGVNRVNGPTICKSLMGE
jgi:hypothetical protein